MESAGVKNKGAAFFCVVTEKLAKTLKDKSTEENPDKSNETQVEIDLPVCRIFLEGGKKSGLISPCSCSGSLVHLKCLELWLTRRKRDECEICQSPYKLKIRRINPTFCKFVCGNPVVAIDIFIWILFTVGILLALAFTIGVVAKFLFDPEDAVLAGATCFMFLHFLAVYSVWIYTALKANISKWREYKILHQPFKHPANTENKNYNNAVSMETEMATEAIEDVASKGDLFFGQNTVIQMGDETSAALLNLNYDPTNQKQNQQSSTFLNPCFANDF